MLCSFVLEHFFYFLYDRVDASDVIVAIGHCSIVGDCVRGEDLVQELEVLIVQGDAVVGQDVLDVEKGFCRYFGRRHYELRKTRARD